MMNISISQGRPIATICCAILLAAALAGCGPRPAEQPDPPAAAPAAPGDAVATTLFGPITLDDVRRQHVSLPLGGLAGVHPARIDQASPAQLEEAAREVAARMAAARAFDQDASTTLTEQAERHILSQRQPLYQGYLRMEYVDGRLDPVSDEEVLEYYEQNKPEFLEPFGFRLRHLILTTYEPYVVAEGDTLESIAERISEDRAKADLIRADLVGRPLRRE